MLERPKTLGAVSFVSVFMLAVIIGLWWQSFSREVALRLPPAGMKVTDVLLSGITAHGIGPGGDESGINVYRMPEDQAKRIEAEGEAYFRWLEEQTRKHGKGWPQYAYGRWSETPIVRDDKWPSDNPCRRPTPLRPSPSLADFVHGQGWCVDIDPDVERMVDEAISRPGSYYVYARDKVVVIVIPHARRLIFGLSY